MENFKKTITIIFCILLGILVLTFLHPILLGLVGVGFLSWILLSKKN